MPYRQPMRDDSDCSEYATAGHEERFPAYSLAQASEYVPTKERRGFALGLKAPLEPRLPDALHRTFNHLLAATTVSASPCYSRGTSLLLSSDTQSCWV